MTKQSPQRGAHKELERKTVLLFCLGKERSERRAHDPQGRVGDGDRTDRQLETPDAGPRFAGYSLLGLSIILYLVSCSYLSSEDTKIDVCRGALVGSPRKVWEAR